MKHYQSFSSKETALLGEAMAKRLTGLPHKAKAAAVFALKGELGAGKTTFVGGFFKGLGLKKRAPSPTFIIMRRHAINHKRFKNIFHVDAYRLKNAAALRALDFQTVLNDPHNVVLIEWADRAKAILPKDAAWLTFRHGKKENERHIMINR